MPCETKKGFMMQDERLYIDRLIAQLDEGILLANNTGGSAWYRWTQDASELLHEIREERRAAKENEKPKSDKPIPNNPKLQTTEQAESDPTARSTAG